MSDDEDDNQSYDYEYESDNQDEVEDDDAWIGNEANGHQKDEEEVNEDKMEEELHGETEPQEPEDDGLKADEDEDLEADEDEADKDEKAANKIASKIVSSNKRKTSKIMTKFEYSYFISQRAMAIEHGSPLMYPKTTYIHSIDIAKEETDMRINPIIIQRVLPSGFIEEWKCSELLVPFAYTIDKDFIKNFKD